MRAAAGHPQILRRRRKKIGYALDRQARGDIVNITSGARMQYQSAPVSED